MITLRSYVADEFVAGGGAPAVLVNPATEEPIAETSTQGIDFAAAVKHARTVGGPALRALNFASRGTVLLAAGRMLHAHRDELIGLAVLNGGNTRGDAKFDIDGA